MSIGSITKLRQWRDSPSRFVREMFQATPDDWQEEGLQNFNANQRMAFKSSKGTGKTTELAWFGWLFMLTRRHPKIMATSITGDNLKAGLWTEMAKWYHVPSAAFLRDRFVIQKESIVCRDHPETWWMQARTWSARDDASQQANSLAGVHAENTLALCDEMGGYPDAVMAAIEAQLAGDGDHKIVGAGNPTHTTGPLYRACTTERKFWYVIQITSDPDNPKRSKRVPVAWALQQIEKFGRDNPYVLVNVFGDFPPSSLNALIGPDEVSRVLGAHLQKHEYEWAQKRLGVDVARFGNDRTCLFPRQGKATFLPVVLRNAETTQISARVVLAHSKFQQEQTFVDGVGVGAGVVDLLRVGRLPGVVEVQPAGKPDDERYANKRAEMWFRMTQALKDGMILPNIPEIVAELTSPTYTLNKQGRLIVEEKDQIKERLGYSPDIADGLAQTFFWAEMPARMGLPFGQQAGQTEHNRDPYAKM